MLFNIKIHTEKDPNSADRIIYKADFYFNEHEFHNKQTRVIGSYNEESLPEISSDLIRQVKSFLSLTFKKINWRSNLSIMYSICSYPPELNKRVVEFGLFEKEDNKLNKFFADFDVAINGIDIVKFLGNLEIAVNKVLFRCEGKSMHSFSPTLQSIKSFEETIKKDAIQKDVAEYKLTSDQRSVLFMLFNAKGTNFVPNSKTHHDRGWIVPADVTDAGKIRNKITVQQCSYQLTKKKLAKIKKDPNSKKNNRYSITRLGVKLIENLIILDGGE